MAQLAERVLGKDEVAGPNPASSSKNPALACGIFIFLYFSGKSIKTSSCQPVLRERNPFGFLPYSTKPRLL